MGYITDARNRAARRRSLWNLLLIPCYVVPWFALVLASAAALGRVYASIHAVGHDWIFPDSVGGVLMAVGLLLTWLGPAMIIANLLVSAVPPARRALDLEASAAAGTDRPAANRGLMRLSFYLTPVGVGLALAGVFILQ